MSVRAPCVIALLFAAGCAGDPAPVELQVEPGPALTRVRLVPAPGWKINALLPPAFEPVAGPIIRFDAESLTADSAYYLVPPGATLPGSHRTLRGTLRASVCAAGEPVCRPYVHEFES